MPRRPPWLCLLLALAGACGTPAASKGPDPREQAAPKQVEPEAPPLVIIEVERVREEQRQALATRLGPDSAVAKATTLLAVRHEIADHWHIYWRNPGETGLATRIELDPESALVGEVLYPAPDRFVASGGQQSYGWEGQTALFLALAEASVDAKVELRSRWLACKESCIPGESRATLTPGEAPLADPSTHADALARVPEPAGARVSGSWEDELLTLASPGARLEAFFPYRDDALIFVGVEAEDAGLRVRYRRSGTPAGASARGIIHWIPEDAAEPRWLELAIPLPSP